MMFGNMHRFDNSIDGVNGVALAATNDTYRSRAGIGELHIQRLGEVSSRVSHEFDE